MRPFSLRQAVAVATGLALLPATAFASVGGGGGSMPWDGPLISIMQDLQGTVAHTLIIIAIVVTGLLFAFGEHGTSMRKIGGIAAGGSLALGAASFVSGLGLGSGAVIGGPGMVQSDALAGVSMLALVVATGIAAARRRRRDDRA